MRNSPAPYTETFTFNGMKNLADSVPCIADSIVNWPFPENQCLKKMDMATREGIDGYVIKAEVRVTAIAKINREDETIEIYDNEATKMHYSHANGEPIPLKEFARIRKIKIDFQEIGSSSCCCGCC